jgi:hypothetical protein
MVLNLKKHLRFCRQTYKALRLVPLVDVSVISVAYGVPLSTDGLKMVVAPEAFCYHSMWRTNSRGVNVAPFVQSGHV